jgi:hypothetical protein
MKHETELIEVVTDLQELNAHEALDAVLSEFEEARRVLPGVAKRAATQLLKTVRGCAQGEDMVDICREQALALRRVTLDGKLPVSSLEVSRKYYSLSCADVARSIYDPEGLGLTYSVQGLAEAYHIHPKGTGDERLAYNLVRDRLQERIDHFLARHERSDGTRSRNSLLAH